MGFLRPKMPKAKSPMAPNPTMVQDQELSSAKTAADKQRKKRGFASTNLSGLDGLFGTKQTLG